MYAKLYGDLSLFDTDATASQLQLLYTDDDSLNDILDRVIVQVYEQLRAKTTGRAEVARRLRMNRTALYQRLESAQHRIQNRQRSKL